MNKFKFIYLLIFLTCLVSLNVYGQRKEISKEEFTSAKKRASEKMKMLSYRIVSKVEEYLGVKLYSVKSDTYEFVPPDKKHNIFRTEIVGLKENSRAETISIGSDEYQSGNNGDWIKRIKSGTNQQPNNLFKTVENNSKYYLTENVQLNNQTTNLYEVIVETKASTPIGKEGGMRETIFYRKEKRWISSDGLWLKMEMEDESQQRQKVVTRQTYTYEYDPNIKIEAPVLKAENKN